MNVVRLDVDQANQRVDPEDGERQRDHLVHGHQLLRELHAASRPRHQENRVRHKQPVGEGNQAVETGGDVAVGVHDQGLAGDVHVGGRRIAHGEHHVVLSFLGDFVVQGNGRGFLVTRNEGKRRRRTKEKAPSSQSHSPSWEG